MTPLLNHSQVFKQINANYFNKAYQFVFLGCFFLLFLVNVINFWFLDIGTDDFCHCLQWKQFK